MSRIVDIKIDAGATFVQATTLIHKEAKEIGKHPITGKPIMDEIEVPVDLSNFTIKATMLDTNGDKLLDFVVGGISGESNKNIFTLAILKADTKKLGDDFKWSDNTDAESEQVDLLGSYDVLAISKDSTGSVTRIYQGAAYLSRARTEVS